MNRILLIHSGGTLGMVKCLHGYTTQKGNLRNLIFSNPNIASRCFCLKETDCTSCKKNGGEVDTFITPLLMNGMVAMVDFYEFPEIIDSASATTKEWCAIVDVINRFYDNYEGFVIIHGTDTLSYAASCLCFMIEGLTVPVVFTGSLLPMVVEGSDAEGNLIGAIESCLLVDSPGVYMFFNGWLHHGARTTKISSGGFDGFYSTNPIRIEDLAECSPIKQISVERHGKTRPFFHTEMSNEVGLFKIFPAIHSSHFKAALDAYKAVILETYGSGTLPTNRVDLFDMIKDYIDNDGVVVNVSQCADGSVSDMYESNDILSHLGVISAKNMTTESAFAKLSLLLASRPGKIKDWFGVSFCGEIDGHADTKLYNFNNYTRTLFL